MRIRYLLAVAIALRLGALSLPSFSTDTNRFLADGINIVAGKNPYTSAPSVAVEYAHLRSFYPPLQQAFFGLAVAMFPSPLIFRILGGIIELSFVLWFFYRKRQKKIPSAVIFFLLFNPLSLHEVWREGHLDHVGVIFLYLAILNVHAAFFDQRHAWRGYAFTFLSIAWKFAGIFALAFRLRRSSTSRIVRLAQRIFSAFALLSILFFAAQWIPAFVFTPFAEQGFTVYANYWHHGNGIVHILQSVGFAAPHAIYLIQRGILLLFGFILALYLLQRLRFYDALWFSLGSMLVLFPVQHAWYYYLLLPMVLLSRQWRNLAMLICCLTPLTYLGYVENFKSVGFFVILMAWLLGCIFHFTRYKSSWLR